MPGVGRVALDIPARGHSLAGMAWLGISEFNIQRRIIPG